MRILTRHWLSEYPTSLTVSRYCGVYILSRDIIPNKFDLFIRL